MRKYIGFETERFIIFIIIILIEFNFKIRAQSSNISVKWYFDFLDIVCFLFFFCLDSQLGHAIQEGQLSVSGERTCTNIREPLRGLSKKKCRHEPHYENTPIQIYRKFHLQKPYIFRLKTLIFFHISAQNIDCGYSLEPPRWGGSNEYPQTMFLAEIRKIMYTPVNPSFSI